MSALETGPNLNWNDVDDTMPMTGGTGKVASERQVYLSDIAVYNATRRKAWVSGVLKEDGFPYASKATSTNGSVTFWITDTGTSGGNAVFTNIYGDTAFGGVYGAAGNYQLSSPTIAGDKKSITYSLSQITTVLGLLSFNGTAAAGLDCRLYVMGD